MKFLPRLPGQEENGHLGAPETPSGVYRALRETRTKLKYGSVLAGIVTLGAIGGGWLVVINVAKSEAQERIAPLDAGMKSLDDRINNTNERLDFLKSTLIGHIDEEKAFHTRAELQQNLLLDAMSVPKWKRPEPADSGR